MGWQSKKLQMQGAQILRSEAYFGVRRNDEGCRVTQQMDFLRSHQIGKGKAHGILVWMGKYPLIGQKGEVGAIMPIEYIPDNMGS
ncbi:MAG: hypothetical protein HY739_07425 [Desulfobacterales bacterium]|nr:hypothetical protein [Desulfobacterales bacterium]